jgi:RNA polymerase sigma-B factor
MKTDATQAAALATRDRIARRYMPEADALARSMARRLRGLAELDDLKQEARVALVIAAARVTPGADPLPYLRRSIAGALRHYIRDRVRLVRVPRHAHEAGGYPFGHASLDAPMHEGGPAFLDLLEAPEPEEPTAPDALAAEVAQMAERLPAADAAALRLLVMEGRSIREAAAALGVAPMTASRRRDRAVDAIRYALGA